MARQRGNRWQGDVFDLEGKRIRKSFATEAEAKAWEAASALAVERGVPLPTPEGVTSGYQFGKFIDESFAYLWGGSKNEPKCKMNCDLLRRYFGDTKDITSFDNGTIIKLIEDLKIQGNSNGTINRKLSHLSKLLKHARDKGYIASIPVLKRQKEGVGRIRFLSDEEETQLLSVLARWSQEDYVALVKFLLYTGCRVGEALRLEWRDIVNNKVTFWVTKADRPRTVPLSSKAREALAYTKSQGWAKPFSEIDYNHFSKVFAKVRINLGLEFDDQFVPHALRHTCASRLVQRGVDIRRVQTWMGHSTIVQTMRYAHLAPADLDVAVGVLDAPPVRPDRTPQEVVSPG